MSSTPKARGVSLTPAGVELLKNRMSDIAREVDKISDQHLARLAGVKTEVVGKYNKNRNSITLEDANKIEQAKVKASKKWTKPVLVTVAAVSIDTIDRMFKPTGVDVDSIKSVASALGIDPSRVVDPSDRPRFVDHQPEFKGELSKFQSLIDRKLKRFVGRRFVFDAIENFFSTNSNGYFTIVGEPGIGKSTILAKYITDKQCVGHFIIRTGARNKVEQFLRTVCNQLIERYNLGYDSLPDRATNDGEFLDELIQKVSKLLPPGERLVIAVDALDEVEKKNEQEVTNLCYLPRYLPDNVYFLLTRRPFLPEEERLLVEAPKHYFNLWKYPKESEKDVKEYIRLFLVDPEFENGLRQWIEARNLSKEEFIEQIAQKSKNNFMYLRCVLSEIAKGENSIYRDISLKALPTDLQDYYEEHWKLKGMNAERERYKVVIICILLEVQEQISCELIADISEEDIDKVQQLLDEWIEFFNQEELEEQTCYSIYHFSYEEFLDQKLEQKKLTVTRREINTKISDYFEKEMDEDDE